MLTLEDLLEAKMIGGAVLFFSPLKTRHTFTVEGVAKRNIG